MRRFLVASLALLTLAPFAAHGQSTPEQRQQFIDNSWCAPYQQGISRYRPPNCARNVAAEKLYCSRNPGECQVAEEAQNERARRRQHFYQCLRNNPTLQDYCLSIR